MDVTVHTVKRITAKLPDDERIVIRVGKSDLAVGAVEFEVTGDDNRILGLITVWGHWARGSPCMVVSSQVHPAAMAAYLAPVVEKMREAAHAERG